ncbi:MAG: acyl-CoA synthetase [Hamadaea sp.]|nr:acyl-CoA synthetase [Hamadaea sp.]
MDGIGIWTIARERPGRAAVFGPDGTTTTYGELTAAADRIGRGLQALGLRPADSLLLLLPNGVDLVSTYFGALQIGLYVVPVNWHLTAAEVAHIAADCQAKAIIADERFADAAREAADTAGISARYTTGKIDGFEPLAGLDDGGEGRPAERTTGAPMVYTSGTSGRPKGVRRPLTGADPDQVPAVTTWFFGLFGLRPFDGHVHLCCSPLYHTAVLNFVIISLQLGHPVAIMEQWDAEQMLRLVERHRVTHSHMVPTQFRRLLALPAETRERYDLSSMRVMIHGAAPCPQEVKRRMLDWWGPVVVEYYAASEGGGTLITAAEWLERPGSVGRAWPGSAVRVLDESGADAPTGAPGKVYLRMGTSTFEYHHDSAKTRDAWADGMFTVGDIGHLDAEGYLYLHDRGSDLIITGGVNVYPAEIESELACHPKVADVAVFGIPDDEWGEEIMAVVQPVAGVTPGDALTEELLTFARGRLAAFKLPRSVVYAEELPRDPNGKLYKRKLRDPYWS